MRTALLIASIVASASGACAPGSPNTQATSSSPTSISVDGQGRFTVRFQQPAWTFGGEVGVPVSHIEMATGSDAIGPYHETTFAYADTVKRTAGIRAYDAAPIVLFSENLDGPASQATFPTMSTYPHGLYHLSYLSKEFSPPSFTEMGPDSPWVFFDADANAFILSAASHFMNAALSKGPSGAISCGIDPAVKGLPAGFSHRTILVAQPGINRAFDTWGHALTTLSGKQRPTNDATVELSRLGYWTDNGATYYYNDDPSKGYPGTLLLVRDSFRDLGVPLGYMQLDSWWYPKGPTADWHDVFHGIYTYTADKDLFPDGLPALRRALGLPLVTHARWIDPSSPYRAMYQMSNNAPIDPAYWNATADYLKQGGVTTYEQDWLDVNALPRTDNLTDQDAFLGDMSRAMKARGLSLQYCMPLPRHHLQGTLYDNLVTVRVSPDRFQQDRWHDALYVSRLASALGTWPWVDVFMSGEEDNLLVATLSAGMVGVGDALGKTSRDSLLKAIRGDGVIVKPDVPLIPVDATYLHGAQVAGAPVLGATHSDHGGMVATYVFAYSVGPNVTASFTPASFGYHGNIYVYDYYRGTGRVASASDTYSQDLVDGRAYFIVVPIGPSGIALLGDRDKFVSLGKQRIAQWSDHGALSATITFASGEDAVVLHGYAPTQPRVTASSGSAGPVTYDPGTGSFSVTMSPAAGSATVSMQ